MPSFKRIVFISFFLVCSFGCLNVASGQRYPVPPIFKNTNLPIARNGFSPTIIATGAERAYIKSLHILDRPYRPLHFYGNAVRRQHFRQRSR